MTDGHVLRLDGCYVSEQTRLLFAFMWFACEHPTRALDEACMFESDCVACAERWEQFGCPVDPLPPLAVDAPVMREVPT